MCCYWLVTNAWESETPYCWLFFAAVVVVQHVGDCLCGDWFGCGVRTGWCHRLHHHMLHPSWPLLREDVPFARRQLACAADCGGIIRRDGSVPDGGRRDVHHHRRVRGGHANRRRGCLMLFLRWHRVFILIGYIRRHTCIAFATCIMVM